MHQVAISVVMPTRNRPDDALRCLTSILVAASNLPIEIVVVDQSTTDELGALIDAIDPDGIVHYVHSELRGAARARNTGWRLTSGRFVAFTDDDCVVDDGWLRALVGQFEARPDVDMLYGTVAIPEHLEGTGFAASYPADHRRWEGRLPGPTQAWGISANVAMRRPVLERLGGFDEALGPGSRCKAGEDFDLMVRAVGADFVVADEPTALVWHHGVRTGDDAARLARDYGVSVGAAFTKHLRLWSRPGRTLLAEWLGVHGVHALGNIARRRRPSGAGFVVGIARGTWASARVPLDRAHRVYATRGNQHRPE